MIVFYDKLVGWWKRLMLEAPPSNDMMVKRLWVVIRHRVFEAITAEQTPADLATWMEFYLKDYPHPVRVELARKAKELYDRLDVKAKSFQS